MRKFQKFNFKMPVKSYENLDSSAINTLKINKNVVFVTYQSNIDKEYEFSCENTVEFDEKVSNTLKNKESIGKLVNSSIKEGKLVDITK